MGRVDSICSCCLSRGCEESGHCRRPRPWARCPVSPQPPSLSLATLSVLGSPREILSVPRTSSVRRPGQSCSRVPQCLGRACGCRRGSAKAANSPRAHHVPPCPTCVRGACALGAAVQQPRPKHGEGLHVQPLVLREVLARGQHREEVCGHSPVHLSDRTWLWEARKDRQLCRVGGAVAGGGLALGKANGLMHTLLELEGPTLCQMYKHWHWR